MKQLTRYIGIHIIAATLIVALLVVGLVFLFTLVGELGSLGHGDYNLWQAIQYILLAAPLQFYQLYPMVSLVGSLMALGMLASRSELTVMRAAGYSIAQITHDVLLSGTLLLVLITALGELWVPTALQTAHTEKIRAINGESALHTESGIWMRDRSNFLHIQTVYPDRHLAGLTRYQFNDQGQLIAVSHIDEARYAHKEWTLKGITKTVMDPNGIRVETTATQQADFNLYPDLFAETQVDSTTLSLSKLWEYVVFQKKSHQPAASDAYTFWRRILQPFSTLVMMFLAVPFVFGSLRSVTIGLRMVCGMVLGGSFYLLNQFLGPLSLVYQVPAWIAASIPTVLFIIIGAFLMRQVR